MTTTQPFPTLSVPAINDTMEMSSPANRPLDDDDIDIDFDDYAGGVHVNDDEHMLEDGETRPATATGTDDMMEDDILPGEEVMADDGVDIGEDEELIDYGEDDFHEDTLVAGEAPPVDEKITRAPETAIADAPFSEIIEEATSEPAQIQETLIFSEDILPPTENVDDDGVHLTEADDALSSSVLPPAAADKVAAAIPDQEHSEQGVEYPPISVNTTLPAETDSPGTPTDTGLHPMTIRYGNLRIPLFKSRRQLDGLLKDDNLAITSLGDLIKSCRQRLAIKTGESISSDQDIVLAVNSLGLVVVEDSPAAFANSLNEILDVYLLLNRNDGIEEVPALSLTLSLQLKFASSFSILKQAAEGGQGMSSFGFSQPEAETEYDHEDFEEGFEDLHGEQTGNGEYADGAGQHELTGEHRETGPNGDDAGEYDEQEDFYQEQEGDHEENAEETHAEDEQPPPPPGLETLLQGDEEAVDALYNAPDDPGTTGQDLAAGITAEDSRATLKDKVEAASTASSNTVQGDATDVNNIGECDLIDWDDDTLTSEESARLADEGEHEDFSTFLTEYDEEAQQQQLPAIEKDEQQDFEAHQEANLTEEEDQTDQQTFDAQHLGSEDFLNDYGAEGQYQDYADDDQPEGEHYEDFEGEEDQNQENYHDQADLYTTQQEYSEEYHPDYEPGEEEQFHIAQQDFFDYEHGGEHDVHQFDEEEEGLDDTVNTVVHHRVEEEQHEEQDFGEDELNFDDEDDIEPPQHSEGVALGRKRSFEEEDFEDEEDEREVKRPRAS